MSESERKKLERDIVSGRRDLKRDQDEFREDVNFRFNEERAKIQKIVYGYSADRGTVEDYNIEIVSNLLSSECSELIQSYNKLSKL